MQKLIDFLEFHLSHFYAQDLILLGLCFFFFIFVLFLSICLRSKPSLSIFLITLGFVGEVFLIYYGNQYIVENYRKSELVFIDNYKMKYSDNIFIDFELKNKSKNYFYICKLQFRVQKPNSNYLELLKNYLNPIRIVELDLYNIPSYSSKEKEIVIPNIKLSKYKLLHSITCY